MIGNTVCGTTKSQSDTTIMGEFKLEYSDAYPCFHCHENMSLGMTECPTCLQEAVPATHVGELLIAFTEGFLIDARSGGLVWGRHDPDDDIPMFLVVAPGILQLSAYMHGGEFIVNNQATFENQKRLWEINSYKSNLYEPITMVPLSRGTRIFNTNMAGGSDNSRALLIHTGQFIVNRHATMKHYDELVEINESAHPKLG